MNPSPPENTRRFSLPAPQRVQVVVFCQPGIASIPGSCCFGGGRHSVAMKLQRRLSVKRRFQATSLCHHEAAGTPCFSSSRMRKAQIRFIIEPPQLPFRAREATPWLWRICNYSLSSPFSFLYFFASFKKLQIIRIMIMPIGKALMMLTD